MNEHQRETEFLRQVILYDHTAQRHTLEERIVRIQRDTRCVRRAMWLMVLLATLAGAGLGCCAILSADFPQNLPRFMAGFSSKAFCVLGLASLICLLAFLNLEVGYRKQLGAWRGECLQVGIKLLASCLGHPRSLPLPRGVGKSHAPVVNGSDAVVSAAEMAVLPKELRRRSPDTPPPALAARWGEPSRNAME